MRFNKHSSLEGKHAYLSPSNYHWMNYDQDKFTRVYQNLLAKERGTKLHALACECIRLGVSLPDDHSTLGMYVNDAINYQMTPEQVLYYSENCFGTADTISYIPGLLRIHDLKSGSNKAYMHQLRIYAALFFLEYGPLDIWPSNTDIELRIYQSNDIVTEKADKVLISDIMQSIIQKDELLQRLKGEQLYGRRESITVY